MTYTPKKVRFSNEEDMVMIIPSLVKNSKLDIDTKNIIGDRYNQNKQGSSSTGPMTRSSVTKKEE